MQSTGWQFTLGMFAVILLGIAIMAVARRLGGPADPLRNDPIQLVLAVVGRVLMAVGVIAASLAILAPTAILLWVVLVVVALAALGEYRLSRRYAFLWGLAAAAQRLIPLVPTIEAFARERSGLFAWRAERLAEMLKAGTPLPEAFDRARPLFPPHALPLIYVGYRSGALAEGLRQAAALGKSRQPLWQALLGRFSYLCLLTFAATAVCSFVMLKIVPSFEKIFKDFGVPMPALTRTVTDGLGSWGAYVVVLVVPAGLLGTALVSYVFLRYAVLSTWDVPGMGWLSRRLDTALIFDALALAVARQRPLPEALECLAEKYPKPSVRRRLRSALGDVHAGGDWCESLRQRGLMQQADLAILRAAQRVGNLPWALREMADSNRRRLAYRVQALMQIAFPPIIVIFGLAVMLFVVSLFLPLIALIQRLT